MQFRLVVLLILANALFLVNGREGSEPSSAFRHERASSKNVRIASPRALPAGCEVQQDVAYATIGNTTLRLDVITPPGDRKNAPIAVYLHGGGYMTGQRWPLGIGARDLLEDGFVVVTVEYRLAPANQWPAPFEDAKAAVRFVRQNAAQWNADPSRIAVWGESVGGSMAILMANDGIGANPTDGPIASVDRIQAAVSFAGRIDWLSPDLPRSWAMTWPRVFRDTGSMRAASPIYHVRPDAAPVFLIQGTQDKCVHYSDGVRMYRAMKEVNAPVEMRLLAGMSHDAPTTHTEITDQIATFMEEAMAR